MPYSEETTKFLRESFSRRAFLASAGALAVGAIVPAVVVGACDGRRDKIRIGVISDTHVTGPESARELEEALSFFASSRVDVVVHCGDVTDLGYAAQLDVFVDSWRRVMPPGVPLVAALGNRDMSDTSKMSEEQRQSDRSRLILANPSAAVKRLCGWSDAFGVRALVVKGVAFVAADWRHEGELEQFLFARPDLRRAKAIVSVQHPHPAGTVFAAGEKSWMADDGRATCYLRMMRGAWSFSGHSHIPFTAPLGFWRGEFTAAAAGSFYLGPDGASGGREVSLLALGDGESVLERRSLSTGFSETIATVPERRRAPAWENRAPGEFVFAQWNIGHFSFGRHGVTDVTAEESAVRAAEYRRLLDCLRADCVGVCEFSPEFDKGGGKARELVFGGFRSFEAGPHLGYQCNAIAFAEGGLSGVTVKDFAHRRQKHYRIACETELGGERTLVVETHLDLGADERRSQIAELVAEFGGCERVILSGDFNVEDGSEFNPFKKAGFALANFGRFGALATHRRRRTAATPAIDNVLVRGFEIVEATTADDALMLSDHRLLVCRLRLAGSGGCGVSVRGGLKNGISCRKRETAHEK